MNGKKDFRLPIEVEKVTAVILPGTGVKSIKCAALKGEHLEIQYVTEFDQEFTFWWNADDFLRSARKDIDKGQEPKYALTHIVELQPLGN